jgi:hypothetical protein
MHRLEYLLLILSERIHRETGNNELAHAAMHFASASHNYEPPFDEPGLLADYIRDWSRRFDKLVQRPRGEKRPAGVIGNTVLTTIQHDELVSANEMADAAGVNRKSFRQALRDRHFPWHRHNEPWVVQKGSPEHRVRGARDINGKIRD